MDEESGTDLMMDCVIIGCDAIKLDGGVINKVGSYSVGLSALFANVPCISRGISSRSIFMTKFISRRGRIMRFGKILQKDYSF